MQISVIVPVYKVEDYLHRCVESILSQTFTDFELILVDDGSPDNCGVICDEYAAKDSRVRVIHQKNGGPSAARNAGINVALGEYFAFVDSDDWIHPQYLELLYRAIVKYATRISCCSYIEIKEENCQDTYYSNVNSSVISPADSYLREGGCGLLGYAWRFLYNKELFTDVRFPAGRYWEDTATTFKLLFQCDRIAYINIPLYNYYIRQGSITKSSHSFSKMIDCIYAYEENIAFFGNVTDERIMQGVLYEYINALISFLRNIKYVDSDYKEKRSLKKKMQRRLCQLLMYNIRYKAFSRKELWIFCYDSLCKNEFVDFVLHGIKANLKDRFSLLKIKFKK